MYLERLAEEALGRTLASGKVGVVVGARQVGKTTLVEHVLAGRKALFLNFDEELREDIHRLRRLHRWFGTRPLEH